LRGFFNCEVKDAWPTDLDGKHGLGSASSVYFSAIYPNAPNFYLTVEVFVIELRE
jgi:hypothetical protein